jgi:pilus assembly protein FimV
VGKSIAGRIVAAALLLVPLFVHAAGLGNLKILSALGQPLNAEIAIVSEQSEELESISARLASQDAFSKAGIEFNPVLLGLTIDLQRRDGKPVLVLRTKQPVNEPFLDILVELQWASGRLVREYTFLLDPPEYKGPQPIAAAPPPAPVAAAPIERSPEKPAPAPPAVEERPIAATPTPPSAAAPTPTPTPTPPPPPTPSKAQRPAEKTYQVKQGDTLGEIARRYMVAGVTYNQMLIALFRANPDAFIRENVNLVRAGYVLSIPGQDDLVEVDPQEAKQQVREHMSEFVEYRRQLAAAAAAAKPAGQAAGQQATAGPITQKPAEPAPRASQDQLKLSKAEPGKPSAAASAAASEDDRIARERALQEAQSRVGELEKNVADLKKLIELKNAQLAEMEKKAAAQSAAPQAPAMAAKPPEMPQPQQATAQAAAQAPAEQPAQPPAAKPAEPAKPAPKPVAKRKPRPVAPPPPPPPSLIDELMENPVALGGIGGIVLLLLGYGAWAWRRKKSSARERFQDSVAGSALGGAEPASVSNATEQQPGGIPSQVSVSQSSVASMEAEEVDPIAEADVYMAYGRDAQAEEILKEALQKDANRAAVHAKLLEIYAGRRDTAAFEQTAVKLKGLTNGAGPEWEKAMTLGRSIDPQNGLYGGGGGSADVTSPRPAAAPAAPAQVAAPTLDFDLDATTQGGGERSPNVDFDLGTGTHETVPSEQSAFSPGGTLKMRMDQEEQPASTGLDFDVGGGEPTKPSDAGLDFELPSTAGEEQPETKSAAETTGAIDFDLDLDTQGPKHGLETSAAQPSVDLSSISLDLGGSGSDSLGAATQTDPKWQEVATKLDLAKAYEDMGDKDGARELLNEVLKEGDTAQKGQAQQMLASLS